MCECFRCPKTTHISNSAAYFLALKLLTAKTPFCAPYLMDFIVAYQFQSLTAIPNIVFSVSPLLKLQIRT